MPSAMTAPIHAQHLSAEKDLLVTRLQHELSATKQKLVEQSEELVQVRSSNLKLQEMLKKKEKDLQSVFAVMREGNTQGAAKRRKEITDRLVNELQQKAHNAEALAQARKLELDELKYSCKSLRLQELHIQAQEYYKEVQRLRDALAAQPAAAPSPRKETRLQANNVEPEMALPVPKKEPLPQPTSSSALPKTDVSASKFVKRKKQAIIEAEYRRQCRIAELAAQCEMEENIPRQAKRLAKQAAIEAAAREPPKPVETTPREPKLQVDPHVTIAAPEVRYERSIATPPPSCLQPAWACPVCLSSTNQSANMCETCGTARPSTEGNTRVLCSICNHRPATHCSECATPVVSAAVEPPWPLQPPSPHIKPAQSTLLASSIEVSQRTYDALLVTVECARGLYDAQCVGKQDPYCFVTCGDISFRTRTHDDGGRDPAWHQELTFPPHCLDAPLAIEIKDENYLHHDGFIGCCELPATAWHLDDVAKVWLPVQHHDTPAGELCVSIRKLLAAPAPAPSKSVVQEAAADDFEEDASAPAEGIRNVTPSPRGLVADSVDMNEAIAKYVKEEAPREELVDEVSEEDATDAPEIKMEHADEEEIEDEDEVMCNDAQHKTLIDDHLDDANILTTTNDSESSGVAPESPLQDEPTDAMTAVPATNPSSSETIDATPAKEEASLNMQEATTLLSEGNATADVAPLVSPSNTNNPIERVASEETIETTPADPSETDLQDAQPTPTTASQSTERSDNIKSTTSALPMQLSTPTLNILITSTPASSDAPVSTPESTESTTTPEPTTTPDPTTIPEPTTTTAAFDDDTANAEDGFDEE